MNPVMSDLAIFVANHEAQVALETRQRAAQGTGSAGPAFFARVTTVVNAIHQFLDPRGHAMSRLARLETAPVPPPATRPVEPVTVLTIADARHDERLAA